MATLAFLCEGCAERSDGPRAPKLGHVKDLSPCHAPATTLITQVPKFIPGGHGEGAGEAKVSELERALLRVDEHVLWLQVAAKTLHSRRSMDTRERMPNIT
eukprot:3217409-Pleurochrysis_carterae.AAC.2